MLFSLGFHQFYPLDRDGYVTGFWPVRYKQKLLDHALGEFFMKGLT